MPWKVNCSRNRGYWKERTGFLEKESLPENRMIRKERMVYDMICWRLEEGGVLGTKKEKLPKWCAVGDDVPYESSLLQKRNILVEAGNLASKHLLDGAVARGLQVGGPLHPILDRSLPAPGQKPRHLTAARALDQSSHLTSDIVLHIVIRLSSLLTNDIFLHVVIRFSSLLTSDIVLHVVVRLSANGGDPSRL